jgi:MSHA biogenesis protein MshL
VRVRGRLTGALLLIALVAGMAACNGGDIPLAKSTTGRNPTVAEVPDEDETVRGASDPAIVTLDLKKTLHERRLTGAEELSGRIIIPNTNLNAVPVTAALQAVLSGTDVSLSWDTGAFNTRLVTVMNLSGSLPKVVEKICSAAKVFCDYRHGSLQLSEKETFVVALPPVVRSISSTGAASTPGTNSMVEAIDDLIGSDKAQVDDQGGNIIYTTNVEGEDRVDQYLAELRTGRPLIVLQMYIWEVALNRENAEGIDWSQFNVSSVGHSVSPSLASNLTSLASTAGSVSLGAVTSGIISTSAVVSFLSSKGRLQTISNPQITFVSGTNAELKVGGTTRYISQVGTLTNVTNVAGTNTSSNSNANASTNTVSTDSIDTGLTIDVAGSYENGVVFANMNLALKNLVSLNPTNSGGGTIDLPQTTDEKMNTVLRVRPGDSLMLAGIVSSADTNSNQGFPTGSDSNLPLYGDDIRQNHELVMIVKPAVVLFADQPEEEEIKKSEAGKPLPAAVMIDGDGSHTLTVPQSMAMTKELTAISTAPAPPPLPVNQEPLAPLPVTQAPAPLARLQPQPALFVPSSGDNTADNAPVDKRMMQRGFSHAFDELMQPAGNVASGGGT